MLGHDCPTRKDGKSPRGRGVTMKRGISQRPNQPVKIRKTERGAVTYRLIKEFKREKLNEDNKLNNVVYWLVQWSGNQTAGGEFKSTTPVLERRRIYICKDGRVTTHKLMGWTAEDLKWMAENWDEIRAAIQRG